MKFIPVRTRPILPPQDDIYPILDTSLPRLREGDVLFVTSKILAIHQGRCVKIAPGVNKETLIKREAERYVNRRFPGYGNFILTIKNSTLIPSAGIDESNGNGYYILWPKNIPALAKELCDRLKKKYRLKKLAVVVTDSHTTPLRYGVLGISVGFHGIEPLKDYRGKPDIFGRKLKYTTTNVVDALSAMAVLMMGEGNERTPIMILRGATHLVRFTNKTTQQKLTIPPEQDIYAPLLKILKKR